MASGALRVWQRRALSALAERAGPDFLAVAAPGAGKTTFALTAVRRALAARHVRRVVVVVPTQHLKHQWAEAADRFGVSLEPEWSMREGELPRDVHGVAVTYQQVASSSGALRALAERGYVVLDEVHHAAESRSWGEAIRAAFEPADRRLSLSGTPLRTDGNPIPFVRYAGGAVEPDFEYGYGRALGDRSVVRPVYFPRINGYLEWEAPDGSQHAHTFDDALDRARSSQRLRTALSLEGDWLPAVLEQAHAQLLTLRKTDARAGGMVIAMDQAHAQGIAELMHERLRVRADVATSDDPAASARIARFAASRAPWIVAVRMVSEGVDIPRLRVGVYATNTTTDLFFRQAVGRLVRWTPGLERQPSFFFIPDDPRLRRWANEIQVERREAAVRARQPLMDGPQAPPRPKDGEQLGLFSVIAAMPLTVEGGALDPADVIDPESLDQHPPASDAADDDDGGHEPDPLDLLPVPPPDGHGARPGPGPSQANVPLSVRKRQLRTLNQRKVQILTRLSGLKHPEVNAELNRRAGIRRISEATEDDLRRRLVAADAWIRTL